MTHSQLNTESSPFEDHKLHIVQICSRLEGTICDWWVLLVEPLKHHPNQITSACLHWDQSWLPGPTSDHQHGCVTCSIVKHLIWAGLRPISSACSGNFSVWILVACCFVFIVGLYYYCVYDLHSCHFCKCCHCTFIIQGYYPLKQLVLLW